MSLQVLTEKKLGHQVLEKKEIHSMVQPSRVALINMPFTSVLMPSLQLGLLKSIVKEHGHQSRVFYPSMFLANRIGWECYEIICEQRVALLGEWLFAFAAYQKKSNDFLTPEVMKVVKQMGMTKKGVMRLQREVIPNFIEEWAQKHDWSAFDIIGFTSSFQQNNASIAMAKAIKKRYQSPKIVFGGANLEGEMGKELMKSIPEIDYAISGEGDASFPHLINELQKGNDPAFVGLLKQSDGGSSCAVPLNKNLDALPTPDYTEYFEDAAKLQLPESILGKLRFLTYESSRGCWWGEKHHCTFCGLNSNGMMYRKKNPEKVLNELEELSRNCGDYPFLAVDNILDFKASEPLFDEISEKKLDFRIWYEVKANLSQPQIKKLAESGVWWFQPGIESLSTEVLGLMNKGATSLINLSILKWGTYYGSRVVWNWLYGFPGEKEEHYIEQLKLMKKIPHLPPPGDTGGIRIDRFSPYFNTPEKWGIKNLKPIDAYHSVYPKQMDKVQIAYYFDHLPVLPLSEEVYQETINYIDQWQQVWESPYKPFLTYKKGSNFIKILDGRIPGKMPNKILFENEAAFIYEYCSQSGKSVKTISKALNENGLDGDIELLRRDLQIFINMDLIVEDNGKYFSLALPENRNW